MWWCLCVCGQRCGAGAMDGCGCGAFGRPSRRRRRLSDCPKGKCAWAGVRATENAAQVPQTSPCFFWDRLRWSQPFERHGSETGGARCGWVTGTAAHRASAGRVWGFDGQVGAGYGAVQLLCPAVVLLLWPAVVREPRLNPCAAVNGRSARQVVRIGVGGGRQRRGRVWAGQGGD